MRDSEFEFIRTLVYERSRISLDPTKRELVAARVAKRLRANRLTSLAEYCRLLSAPEQEDERSRLIDVISTNHTFFFRESDHFEFVGRTIVPEMRARAQSEGWARFHAWSAACSSGEEPYSLGITLAEALGSCGWNWRIEATDISHGMLATAEAGIYPQSAINEATPLWARRYFQRGIGPQVGTGRVWPAIKAGVAFRQLNLLDALPPYVEPFQLIFCRNVMIYFDQPTQAELVCKLARHLVPGGYLIIGHSESLAAITQPLTLVRPSIYQKPARP
jgi:chemotaxis protein methyltransferase CheR